MLTVITSPHPTANEIKEAFASVAKSAAFVDFRYKSQLKPSTSPSALAAKADTIFIGEPDHVKSWLGSGCVQDCKNGKTILKCRTMNRRAKCEGVTAQYYENRGAYMWRSFRLEGIDLKTVSVLSGGKRFRLFPNAD